MSSPTADGPTDPDPTPGAGPRRLTVIGGGVSGLVAAYELRRRFPDAELTVVEASGRIGGALDTAAFPSGPVETGAEAFIVRRPEARELLDELGLGAEVHYPGSASPAILAQGGLQAMPRGTYMGVPSDAEALAGVLAPAEVERVAAEPSLPLDWAPGGDVSLGDLVGERFGPGVVTRLLDPMVGGVYAASSRGLGLRDVIPPLAAALDDGAGSLTEAVRTVLAGNAARAAGGPGERAPVFGALEGGYARLVERLAEESRAAIVLHTRVTSVQMASARMAAGGSPGWGEQGTGRFELTCDGPDGTRRERTDGVVLACPAPQAAQVLADTSPGASHALSGIRTASSAVVALEVSRDLVLPERSGVLVATDEPVPYKAMTFLSRKWPHLDDRKGHLVRVSFGRLSADGAPDPVLEATDDELVRIARDGLADLCGAAARPDVLHAEVRRWEDTLPEFAPGHGRRIREIRDHVAADLPGAELVGAVTEGLGVPACIGSARAAVRRLAARWQDEGHGSPRL